MTQDAWQRWRAFVGPTWLYTVTMMVSASTISSSAVARRRPLTTLNTFQKVSDTGESWAIAPVCTRRVLSKTRRGGGGGGGATLYTPTARGRVRAAQWRDVCVSSGVRRRQRGDMGAGCG